MSDGVRPTESGEGEGGEQLGGTAAAAFDPREFVEAVSGADTSKYYTPVIICSVVGRKADCTNEGRSPVGLDPLRRTPTVVGKTMWTLCVFCLQFHEK